MIAYLLDLLFIAAGLLAIAGIAGAVRRHGSAILALRQSVRSIEPASAIDFHITELRVVPTPHSNILRPEFGVSKSRREFQPCLQQPCLPAAA